MFRGKVLKEKENKENNKILAIFGLIFITISAFVDIVLTGPLGLVFLLFISLISGKKGANIFSIIGTIGVSISSYINYGKISIIGIIGSFILYYFTGSIVGKKVDKIKEQEEVLRENNENLLYGKKRLRGILETTQDGFYIIGENQRFIDVNQAYCNMTGYTKKEILNLSIVDIDIHQTKKEIDERIESILNGDHQVFETKHLKKNGEYIEVEISVSCLTLEKKELICFCRDITEKKKDQQKILEMKERLENIIKGTNVGTWEWNIIKDSTVVNSKYAEMIGYKLEEISPMTIGKWEKLIHNDDILKYKDYMKKIWNKEIEYYDIEIRIKHKNGEWKWINSRGKITKWSDDGNPIIMSGTHTDINEKKQEQEKIEYLSFHDHLTGLYNRRYMEDSINRLDIDRNIPFSIISIDVNGLKLINDIYGHEKGDELLIIASEILKKSCRKEDIICRVGGDEFVILLPKIGENKVKEIIKRMEKESSKNTLEPIVVSLATGYSTKKNKEKNIFEVFKEADNNMYNNKLRNGRIMRIKTIKKALSNVNLNCESKKNHSERVSYYCEKIAKAMNLDQKEIEKAKLAGKLHDVGKVAISPKILKKKKT